MNQKNQIIACINGMPFSESVCDYAVWFAQQLKQSIQLFHVLDVNSEDDQVDLSGNIGMDANDTLLDELVSLEHERNKILQRRGKIILERANNRIQRHSEVTTEVCLRHGEMVENLQSLIGQMEMVILGRYGQKHLNKPEKAIGHRVESVIRSIEKPVLVISQAFAPIHSILVAYDGSASSEKAVHYLLSHLEFNKIKVHLVYVGTPGADKTNSLKHAAERLQAQGYQCQTQVIDGGEEAEASLLSFIQAHNVGLTIMGAFGHHWLRELLMGSFTSKMLSLSQAPLLLVR